MPIPTCHFPLWKCLLSVKSCYNLPVWYVFVSVSKVALLSSLDSSFKVSSKPLPLLVRIIHKSRLRYYGKFGLKVDYPYQVSLTFIWFNNIITCSSSLHFELWHICWLVVYIPGIFWSCRPEWFDVARALERTLSRVLQEAERRQRVVHPELLAEAELFQEISPTTGPLQDEELHLCRYVPRTLQKTNNKGQKVTPVIHHVAESGVLEQGNLWNQDLTHLDYMFSSFKLAVKHSTEFL